MTSTGRNEASVETMSGSHNHCEIRIKDLRADKKTTAIAQEAAASAPAAAPERRAEATSVPPAPPRTPEREDRASIDLSPAGREVMGESERIEEAEPKPPSSEGKP